MEINKQPKPITQIEVFRDGQYDTDYIRTIRVQKAREIGATFVHGAFTALEAVSTGLGKFVTPIALEWHDSLTGDTLRSEYFEKKRAAASEEIRSLIEL